MKIYKKWISAIGIAFLGYSFYLILLKCSSSSPTLTVGICNLPPSSYDLSIPPIAQESDSWCWAASITMIINYYDSTSAPIRQCQTATERIQLINSSVSQSACDCYKRRRSCIYPTTRQTPLCGLFLSELKPLPIDTVTAIRCDTLCAVQPIIDTIRLILEKHNLTVQRIINQQVNTLDNIKLHLKVRHPIVGIYFGRTGGFHIVVIKGYTDFNYDKRSFMTDGSYLFINNPLNNEHADCKYCYHWILTQCNGMNANANSRRMAKGTYRSVAYLAVIPKI